MTNLAKVTHAWEIPKVYLAGGIFGLSDEDARAWRTRVTQILEKSKLTVIDPMERDCRGVEDELSDSIVARDLKFLRMCDAVVVNLSTAGCGTAMELVYAKLWGIPVVGFNSTLKPISPWLKTHSRQVVNIIEACDTVKRWLVVK